MLDLGLEFFISRPIEIEVAPDFFRIIDYYSDKLIVRRVYTPSIFMQSSLIAQEAMAKWKIAKLGDNIIRLRR